MKRRDFIQRICLHAGALTVGGAAGCAQPRFSKGGSFSGRRPNEVLNGIDVFVKQNFAPLKKLRLGLITNHTGHDRQRRATIDLLKNAPELNLVALFSPEHGIRGQADEKIGDSVDQKTGLPVYSLYGERRVPTLEQLRGLDALVYDIQDIGCRFYTYPSTMGLCLEASAKAKLKFFVLDRVNPINGVALEGPLHTGQSSFTAFHSVPLRHGMTVGELARIYNAEKKYGADLTVIPIEGWRREMWFDETGLPWTNPSPNMRSLAGATLYPGIGLHETPLCELPGIRFVPVRFTPTYSTFKDKPCAGVAFVIADRDKLSAVDLGVQLALTLQRLYPDDFALAKVNTLLQHTATIDAIKAGKTLAEIKQPWAAELAAFKKRHSPFLLYK
jgi:uncharacterized protein YbbC (DUF1343 family)